MGHIWRGTTWVWVIVGAVFAVIIVIALVRPKEQRVPQVESRPTPTATRYVPLTPTTYTDIVVWRFCSDVLAGTLTEQELRAVYDLDTTALSKDREWAMRVVRLVRREVDTPGFNAEAVAELHALCQDWRRADWERYQSQ